MMSKTVSRNNRRSREEWERLMAEYEAGGVSRRVFCTERGLAYSNFGYWRKQLRGALPRRGQADASAGGVAGFAAPGDRVGALPRTGQHGPSTEFLAVVGSDGTRQTAVEILDTATDMRTLTLIPHNDCFNPRF